MNSYIYPISLFLVVSAIPQVQADVESQLAGEIRPRYAELESAEEPGKAASVRLRGRIETHWSDVFQTMLELDYVADAFEDEHNNGVTLNAKPSLPDAPGVDVNQLWFSLVNDFGEIKLGRQAIDLDDQRFVSTVGFWQNEQTFDALRINKPLFSASKLMYSYLANANRIHGDDADEDNVSELVPVRPAKLLGDHEHDTHLLRLEVNEWDFMQWVTYAYFIDNKDLPATSNHTVGSRYELTMQPSSFRYHLEAELAQQSRTEVDDDSSNTYGKLILAASYHSFELSGRYEYLGASKSGNQTLGVVTPLGSLHEFQGWADALNEIHGSAGIEDSSIKLKWRTHPWKLDVRYHWFDDTESSVRYGREVDFDISLDITRKQEILLRFADFSVSDEAAGFLKDEKRVILTYTLEL